MCKKSESVEQIIEITLCPVISLNPSLSFSSLFSFDYKCLRKYFSSGKNETRKGVKWRLKLMENKLLCPLLFHYMYCELTIGLHIELMLNRTLMKSLIATNHSLNS
jgi:hypothetical protein